MIALGKVCRALGRACRGIGLRRSATAMALAVAALVSPMISLGYVTGSIKGGYDRASTIIVFCLSIISYQILLLAVLDIFSGTSLIETPISQFRTNLVAGHEILAFLGGVLIRAMVEYLSRRHQERRIVAAMSLGMAALTGSIYASQPEGPRVGREFVTLIERIMEAPPDRQDEIRELFQSSFKN